MTQARGFLILTLAVSGLCACGSAPQRLYEGTAKDAKDIATVTNSCGSSAKDTIRQAAGLGPNGEPMVQSVDGKKGSNNVGRHQDVFNSAWDTSFNLHLMPGHHVLSVHPNYFAAVDLPNTDISFDAIAGHDYCLVQALSTGYSTYRWYPILVDQTDNRLISPENIPWKAE